MAGKGEAQGIASTQHLLISEFNLVMNYAPYLGIFAFPLKTDIFSRVTRVGLLHDAA